MSSSSVADTGQEKVYPREAMLGLLRRHGRSPLSFLLRYDAPWEAFLAPEGAVGYLSSHGVAGGLVGPALRPADTEALLRTFTRTMRADRLGICLMAIDEITARAALACGYSVLKVGGGGEADLRRPSRGAARGVRGLLADLCARGWYLEDLFRAPGAVNGASELLVVETLAGLRDRGTRSAALGIAPFRAPASSSTGAPA